MATAERPRIMRTYFLRTAKGNPAPNQTVEINDRETLFRSYGRPVARKPHQSDVVELDGAGGITRRPRRGISERSSATLRPK